MQVGLSLENTWLANASDPESLYENSFPRRTIADKGSSAASPWNRVRPQTPNLPKVSSTGSERYMQLWNDYEGKTIANTYALGQLLRPEGRSALFALSEGAESPAVIRLTESINDESQLMANWKRVSQLHQENLVVIKRFGETTLDGTPLTYAVMEPADANLADLLKERPLTQAETMQVAISVASALSTLHEQGLIHGSIDASQIVAVGETVKLRTDSVRPCAQYPDDASPEACQKLIQRDVHDFATTLLRTLTLESTLKPGLKLPAPFDQIIINGLSGAWGLAEISNVLNPPVAHTPASVAAAIPESAAAAPRLEPAKSAPASSTDPLQYQRRINTSTARVHPHMKLWIALGVAAVIILAVLIRGISSSPHSSAQTAEARPAAAEPARRVVTRLTPTAAPATRAAAPAPVAPQPAPSASSRLRAGWYVVAYTFNREADAVRRATAIAKSNPGLHPQVITPYGNKPYLVALGGPMSRPDAESIQRRAKQSGLPRDTFVRNYKGE